VICPDIRHVWSVRPGRLGSKFMARDGRHVAEAADWSATRHVPSVLGVTNSLKATPHRADPDRLGGR
jgi:cellobiose transport system substrate-binding protein